MNALVVKRLTIFKSLGQSLLAGVICGALILALFIAERYLESLNSSLAGQLTAWLAAGPEVVVKSLLPQSFVRQLYGYDWRLPPVALWFTIGFVVRLLTRSNRATLYICILLFVLAVAFGEFSFMLNRGIGD